MKNFTLALVLTLAGASAQAAFDMNQLASLNGRTGVGVNAYEEGGFKCTIEISADDNSLAIYQPDAYASTMLILGDSVKVAEQNGSTLFLQTNSSNPSKSGLCGDHMTARSVVTEARISKDEVTITTSYRCGFIPKRNADTFSCKLK